MMSRSQPSPILLALLVGLLAAAAQSLPLTFGSLDNVAPVSTSPHLPSSAGCRPLLKRAVGGITMSGALSGLNGRSDVVRRAVGTVADPACGPGAAIQATSTLAKRSSVNQPDRMPPIDLSGSPVASIADDTPPVADALQLLVKRSKIHASRSFHPTNNAKPSRVQGRPDTEEKWGRWSRAW